MQVTRDFDAPTVAPYKWILKEATPRCDAGDPVVIKSFFKCSQKAGDADAEVAAFSEALLLSKADHPNVVRSCRPTPLLFLLVSSFERRVPDRCLLPAGARHAAISCAGFVVDQR